MRTTSFRIWTWIAKFTSYDDNRYITSDSNYCNTVIIIIIIIINQMENWCNS